MLGERVRRLKGIKIAEAKPQLQRFRVRPEEHEIPAQLGARRAISSQSNAVDSAGIANVQLYHENRFLTWYSGGGCAENAGY